MLQEPPKEPQLHVPYTVSQKELREPTKQEVLWALELVWSCLRRDVVKYCDHICKQQSQSNMDFCTCTITLSSLDGLLRVVTTSQDGQLWFESWQSKHIYLISIASTLLRDPPIVYLGLF